MTNTQAKEVLDKVIGQIFGYQNPLTMEQAFEKFTFDIQLPQQVTDTTTGEATWAQSISPTRFITLDNARKRNEIDDWVLPKRPISSIDDIIAIWNETNLMSTERVNDSINVSRSDAIYNSENVYNSVDCTGSKNIVWCDAVQHSEFVAASQRSNSLSFCLRTEDSKESSNSFSVIWSAKINNSLFIQDCYDLMDCMFCSHMASKRFCIANMQFEEAEYRQIRDQVVRWILTA